ncbi:hypothetical protein [Psychroserpens sp. NJDZ02]|uniref:hypothetical protein n=1 Tax=Psychroserpens sp. NJDZ02 TaxID=2570561 RepID=UPI0010A89364|nr:hypothetical protein [Psychroserpens sp. NJDZ02]QCE43275.1 hypothetical protein E9099_18240 [Psychroserpens sp. NJDZ02]
MGTITLRDYPNEILQFELPEVESDIIRIHIHMVRIYNDGTTILSVIKMTIRNKCYYYTSVSSDTDNSSPARAKSYHGYLIRKNDDSEGDNENMADSQKNKKRIETVFKNLKKYDLRLPEIFHAGKQNYNGRGHNGLRIYDPDIAGNTDKNGNILPGGNRFFHVGALFFNTVGCEALGTGLQYYVRSDLSTRSQKYIYDNQGLYGTRNTAQAAEEFLDNIIKVYEDNILRESQSTIHIDIDVVDNIQDNFSKRKVYNAEETYLGLYPVDNEKALSTIKTSGPILKDSQPSAPKEL